MDANIDILGLAEQKLGYVDRRQAVLAQNIANANTPGYVAKDLKPFSDVLAASQRTTANMQTSVSGLYAPVTDTSGTGQSLNGNGVVLDQQLEKVAETETSQQLAMNLYKAYASLYRTALGRS
jgi:flagellar basal-body rod protein FlgB